MSTSNSTTKSTYHHLTACERGEIFAYHRQGKKPAEIARLMGRHRSTISRELKRGAVTQVKQVNGRRKYTTAYFPETSQLLYEKRRQNSVYCKLDWCTERFIEQLVSSLKAKPRVHSVDTFYPHLSEGLSAGNCAKHQDGLSLYSCGFAGS